jgi:hypothetical protein
MIEMLKKNPRTEEGLSTGPIFLTCFTNHALDQFLEKISLFTKNIVRLGDGTKNEFLKQFSLEQMKRSKNINSSGDCYRKIKA